MASVCSRMDVLVVLNRKAARFFFFFLDGIAGKSGNRHLHSTKRTSHLTSEEFWCLWLICLSSFVFKGNGEMERPDTCSLMRAASASTLSLFCRVVTMEIFFRNCSFHPKFLALFQVFVMFSYSAESCSGRFFPYTLFFWVLPPVFVSTHKKVRWAVSQVDAGEVTRGAADTSHKFARLYAVDVDLENKHTQKQHLFEIWNLASQTCQVWVYVCFEWGWLGFVALSMHSPQIKTMQ